MKDFCYLFLFSLLFLACSSPQKLYEKGKYDKAFDKVLDDLKDKKTRKNKVLLNKSFSKLIDQQKEVLEDEYEATRLDEYKKNLRAYKEIEDRYYDGVVYLDDDNVTKYEGFINNRSFTLDRVYDSANAMMDRYEQSGKKSATQEAYYHYILMEKYAPDYIDVRGLIEESLAKGTLVYNIVPDLIFDISYRWDVNRRFDDIEGRDGFVQYLYDEGPNIGDCYIELEFRDLDEERSNNSSTQTFSKKVQDGYETKVDTSGKETKVPIYKTVEGAVTTSRRTKRMSWKIYLDIRDLTGNCNVREERFLSEISDVIEEYEIRGDQRAIPSEYLNQDRQNFRSDDDMVDDLIDDLYRKFYNYIR